MTNRRHVSEQCCHSPPNQLARGAHTEFTDTRQAIRDVFRQYMTNELEPRTEAFESGEESIFPFMRKMIKDLGLDAAMGQGDSDGSAGQRAAKLYLGEVGTRVAKEAIHILAE